MNARLHLDSEFPFSMLTLNFQDVFAGVKQNNCPEGSIITMEKREKKSY